MDLTGRTAVVAGASRGIGKAIAVALANAGAQVVVVARTNRQGHLPGTIYQTVLEIENNGGHALPIQCDITDEEQVQAMVASSLEHYGRIDVLVNNAAIILRTPIVETAIRHWDLILRVNLKGPFLCTKFTLPAMMAQRQGSIINITSRSAELVRVKNVPYSVTKAGLNMLTRGLAEEMKAYDVAVNALDPGMVKTEGAVYTRPSDYDWTGWADPEAVGPAVVFLAAQTAKTFTGQVVMRADFGQNWP